MEEEREALKKQRACASGQRLALMDSKGHREDGFRLGRVRTILSGAFKRHERLPMAARRACNGRHSRKESQTVPPCVVVPDRQPDLFHVEGQLWRLLRHDRHGDLVAVEDLDDISHGPLAPDKGFPVRDFASALKGGRKGQGEEVGKA